MMRISQTTPATAWELLSAPGDFPKTFTGKLPKAIFLNAAGTVQIVGRDGVSVTITPVEGVPIQVRPQTIQTASVDVVVLYD